MVGCNIKKCRLCCFRECDLTLEELAELEQIEAGNEEGKSKGKGKGKSKGKGKEENHWYLGGNGGIDK